MDRAECPWILLGLRMVMGIFCEIMQKSHLFCHFHVQKMMARGSWFMFTSSPHRTWINN